MKAASREPFRAVRSEGGLLPPDLLARVAAGDRALPGLAPADYLLDEGERLNEAINRSWARLTRAWAAFAAAREKLGPHDPGTTPTRERWLLVLFEKLASTGLAGKQPFAPPAARDFETGSEGDQHLREGNGTGLLRQSLSRFWCHCHGQGETFEQSKRFRQRNALGPMRVEKSPQDV